MPFPAKTHNTSARTHSEARACVCAVCLDKKNVRPAKPDTESMIQTFISPYYSLNKENLPSAICQNCKQILVAHKRVR